MSDDTKTVDGAKSKDKNRPASSVGRLPNNDTTEAPKRFDASKPHATPKSGSQLVGKSTSTLPDKAALTSPSERKRVRPNYIAAIGASAGGLKPLEDFFQHIPSNTGVAFVVVQHLSPDFKSLMLELLTKVTDLPIEKVVDGVEPEANRIYLITPRKNLTLVNGKLHLEDQKKTAGHNPNFPIDIFFRSLAKDIGNRAIGIILSGTGSDGSRGVRSIDEAGGLIFVQSTDSAQFDGMPNAAIMTGTAQEISTPAQIAESLIDIAEATTKQQHNLLDLDEQTTAVYNQIVKMVAEEKGVDFRLYKSTTISRRVERRRLIAGADSLATYLEIMQANDAEVTALRNDLLVSVTCFFRDESAWRKLQETYFPELIQNTKPHETIRVWVSACATGEEAYTMAIVLREVLNSMGRQQQEVKIFATDIDEPSLEHAVRGRYPESIVADVPLELLTRYFDVDGGYYQVKRVIREMIIFAPHNLLVDAPFTRTHIVSCRNALIYLRSNVQKHVVSVLHFSLVNNGLLFLGSSETVGDLHSEFKVLDQPSSVHKKLRDVRLTSGAAFKARSLPPRHSVAVRSHGDPEPSDTIAKDSLISSAFGALASQNDTLYLICDRDLGMLHAVGNTQTFLKFPQGNMSNDVSKLVPDSLAIPLSTAMHRARRENNAVNYHGIKHSDNPSITVDIQAVYQPETSNKQEMHIVLLKAVPVADDQFSESALPDAEHQIDDATTQQRLKDLEVELNQTRGNLQSTIEALEANNQTHQSTNEQLTTANEELQSTNEELHSVNEELYTVNSEHQVKINELTELNNDIDNLLESTEIGVVFLDEELNIRKFTPAASTSVRLHPNDIGRSFEDLTYDFDYPQLSTDIRRVLSLGEAIEREAAINDDDFILVRIHPYRAGNELTVGVVISFIDISELKHVEDALAQVEVRYRHLFQSDLFGIVVSSIADRTVIDANDTFLNLIDADRSKLPLKHQNIYPENDLGTLSLAVDELLTSGTTPPTPARLLQSSGEHMPVIISRTLISQKDGTYVEFVIDATELKQQQREIQLKTDEMEMVSGNLQQFAYIASHELLEPLRSLSGYSNLLADRCTDQLDAKGEKYVDFILEASTRMSRVIDDLLLFSRVHTEGRSFELVDANVALQAAREQIISTSEGIDIHWELPPLPRVYADKRQLTQLFYTLLDNAVKFRSHRDLFITVDVTQNEDDWQFSVTDNGIGLDASDSDKVFAIFKRLHTREAYPGSGVGLAICKRIIERHKGTIWVESNNQRGSSFKFTLPQSEDSIKMPMPIRADRL